VEAESSLAVRSPNLEAGQRPNGSCCGAITYRSSLGPMPRMDALKAGGWVALDADRLHHMQLAMPQNAEQDARTSLSRRARHDRDR
jgi:hypothetical protein